VREKEKRDKRREGEEEREREREGESNQALKFCSSVEFYFVEKSARKSLESRSSFFSFTTKVKKAK
jgi:hypothetical protein